jgi:hypothetical protein
VDAPAERLARVENVGSNICVSVCCLMWGRTFVDSWLVFPAPLEVRRSAWKGVQLFWPTVSSWARVTGRIGTGRAVRNRENQLDETRLDKEQIVNLSITYCKTIVN